MARNPNITPALKLATTALARATNPLAASKLAGVDVRTVKSWLAEAPVEDPEADWTAVKALATERALAAVVSGKSTGATAWTTVKAVAERNLHMAKLIAQRERRKATAAEAEQPEPEKPWRIEFDALSDERQRLFVLELDEAIRRDDDRAPSDNLQSPEPGDEDKLYEAVLAQVRQIAAMTDEQVAKRSAALKEAERAHWERTNPPPPVRVAPEPPQPPPTPPALSQRLPAPSRAVNPGLRVVRDDEIAEMHDEDHLWHPY